MSIKQDFEKIKSSMHTNNVDTNSQSRDVFLIVILVFVALSSFALGRISNADVMEKSSQGATQITHSFQQVTSPESLTAQATNETSFLSNGATGEVVASKNSTKYHFPWCSGAQRIKESNKITFETIQSARDAGYSPASNCKGLQ